VRSRPDLALVTIATRGGPPWWTYLLTIARAFLATSEDSDMATTDDDWSTRTTRGSRATL
jgi:hypothetical protein